MPHVANPKSALVGKLEGLHLFHFDGAPCAQRVRFALREKGLKRGREVVFDDDAPAACEGEAGAWVSREVSLIRKDHLTPAYAEIHANLVVPALVHDGELILESMDIIAYLDEALGGPALVPKDDADVAADAAELTRLGEELHRSIRFVTFRWGLRGLARLNRKEEQNLRALLAGSADDEQLVRFYEGFDSKSFPDAIYVEHLEKLNAAFRAHEGRLQDGRAFLTGAHLTMADVLWAMKTLRLTECGYPFATCFPAWHAWYGRITSRPAFQEGVMGKHRFLSKAFQMKARVEDLLGIGLRREVLRRLA